MDKESIVGNIYNQWKVLDILPNGKCSCQCSCGVVKEQYRNNIINGKTKSCGHERKNNLVGKTINNWTVLEEVGYGKVVCRCVCGTVRELYKKAVVGGQSKSCGCKANDYMDLTGKHFGEWKVLRYLGDQVWECRCSCGNIGKVYRRALIDEVSKSCGCKQAEHSKNTLKIRYGETNTRKIDNPRNTQQIEAVSSKRNFESYIKSLGYTPTIKQLSRLLGVNESTIGVYIHRYKTEDLVDMTPMVSEYENEIYEYIREIYDKDIVRSSRTIIGGNYELDIYLPDSKLAVEFNGNYWHSELQKDKHYHRDKTIRCIENNIQLLHIFEYEWVNNKEVVKRYLYSVIHGADTIVNGRNTVVKEVDDIDEVKNILEANHIQGYAQSSINIGLYYNNKIVGIMTFGRPRFSANTYEYELIRLCYEYNIGVVGGSEKLFSYFCKKYNPNSVVSYCNLSKFKGIIYNKLGFKQAELSKEGYVWVNNNKVLSRYQTQKNELIRNGLGEVNQTEDEIMHSLNYYKIYDCGNIKYEYYKE